MSINGVNLKLSRDDANDDEMQGINQNRLTREMRKVKPGDDVSLEVWGGGRSRTVKVKTVAAADLNPVRTAMATRDEDRAALGIYLSVTGNKRDTAGVFVQRVSDGGPADKAASRKAIALPASTVWTFACRAKMPATGAWALRGSTALSAKSASSSLVRQRIW